MHIYHPFCAKNAFRSSDQVMAKRDHLDKHISTKNTQSFSFFLPRLRFRRFRNLGNTPIILQNWIGRVQ